MRSQSSVLATLLLVVGSFAWGFAAQAGSFLRFISEPEAVTHPTGYDGTSGHLAITVGIDPQTAISQELEVPVKNVITIYNGLHPTTGNMDTSEVPGGEFDFETRLSYVMGLALGLGNSNLAVRAGSFDDAAYTNSNEGPNGSFDLSPGADGIKGSADDLRNNDVNLVYFRKSDTDPFAPLPAIVDSTTYSRNLADLPGTDTFPTSAGRDVGAALGYANTEGVMHQRFSPGESRRTLTADAVSTLRYGMAGLDELQGQGGDDYTFELQYAGMTTNADVVVTTNTSLSFFARVVYGAIDSLGDSHHAMTDVTIEVNPTPDAGDWYFTSTLRSEIVYADFNGSGAEDGSEGAPWDTLQEALNDASDGTEVRIDADGDSPETLTINQPVTIEFTGGSGSARIGATGARSVNTQGRQTGFVSDD